MTREYLINMLISTNWIKTKEYDDEVVYQKLLIDEDFIEITVYPVRYEIEYFTQVGPGTYNSYMMCTKFFAYEYDDERIIQIERNEDELEDKS